MRLFAAELILVLGEWPAPGRRELVGIAGLPWRCFREPQHRWGLLGSHPAPGWSVPPAAPLEGPARPQELHCPLQVSCGGCSGMGWGSRGEGTGLLMLRLPPGYLHDLGIVHRDVKVRCGPVRPCHVPVPCHGGASCQARVPWPHWLPPPCWQGLRGTGARDPATSCASPVSWARERHNPPSPSCRWKTSSWTSEVKPGGAPVPGLVPSSQRKRIRLGALGWEGRPPPPPTAPGWGRARGAQGGGSPVMPPRLPAGHLKLTDFGLSRHLPRGERAYTICGTLQYMGELRGWGWGEGWGRGPRPP